MLIYIHDFVNFIDMTKIRYFRNLVISHLNLPLPEPLRSEVIAHFYYEDYGENEWLELYYKTIPSWREIFTSTSLDDNKVLKPLNYKDRKRYEELSLLREKYKSYETEDDGYDDELIQQCVLYARDEDSFKLNEKQREIAIELIQLKLLRFKFYEEYEPWIAEAIQEYIGFYDYEITLNEEERSLKQRYLSEKYGRRERLEREREEEEERAKRSRIAACLGPGFTIDW